MASGERLTIAVAAIGENGECRVSPAIRPHVLDVMFGLQSAGMASRGSVLQRLQRHLQFEGGFEGGSPPMSGMQLGAVRKTVSSDVLGLLRQAVAMTASPSGARL